MSILIEDIYCKSDKVNLSNIKIKDLSYYEKYILGINEFHGYQDNTISDVAFMSRIPMQMIAHKYHRIQDSN